MTTFDSALDDCLKRIKAGEADVDACLKLYPQYADQLRPLLQAAWQMQSGSKVDPSSTFAPGTRAEVYAYADANPRRRRGGLSWYFSPALRWAAIAIVLVIALLLAGTAYAQTAYPGDMLYAWKRGSENVSRAIIPAPIQVDLFLSRRRMSEVLAVRHDAARLAIAWAGYRAVMERLLAYDDPTQKEHIADVLREEWEQFVQLGVPLPTGSSALPPVPTPIPTGIPTGLPQPTSGPSLSVFTPTSTSTPGPPPAASATETGRALPTLATPTPLPTFTSGPTRTPFTPLPTWTEQPTFPPPPTIPCLPPFCP